MDHVSSIARAQIELRKVNGSDTFDCETRFADVAEDTGSFSGYAARFEEVNRHGEIVRRGAFARTLQDHAARSVKPPMFWSHNYDEVIGVWDEIREDDQGLAVRGRLITETSRGREAHALLKAGALSGLSIGFRARQQERASGGVRILKDIELMEISLVALPSAGRARIQHVRSAEELASLDKLTLALKRTSAALRKD